MEVVLNWFTQGAILAIAAAAGLRVIPLSRAHARYGVVWTAYLLVLALPTVPLLLAIALDAPGGDLVAAAAAPVVTIPASWWTSPAVAIGLWMIWSCIQTIRLGVGALGVREARRRGRECPADVLARLPHWSRVSASGRRTRVILSSQVRAAAVLGCGRPTIALAPTLVEQLSVADLDRVLVHEWAHVQRGDDLAQLVQGVVRIAVGWHPGVWWLEQQLEFEREAACDEIAVSVTGSAKGYAACLATLAALPQAPLRLVPALAAASPSRLGGRLVRILAAPGAATPRPWHAITICGAGGLLACTLVIGNLHLVASAVASAVVSAAGRPLGATPVVRDVRLTSRSAETSGRPSSSVPAGRQGSRENPRSATEESGTRPRGGKTVGIEQPSAVAIPPLPFQASAWPLDPLGSATIAMRSPEPPVKAAGEAPALALTAATDQRAAEQARAAWTRAADIGVGIGRASQSAGTATAGFFNRVGKKLAGAF